MEYVKISELPAATTPLLGTEIVEVVQAGVSKRVAASYLLGDSSSAIAVPMTRSALNTTASEGGIVVNEVYRITDEDRLAVGLSSAAYETFAKESEVGSGTAKFTKSMAYLGTATNSPSAATAKVPLDTTAFDPDGMFDGTNHRFVPRQSGYYLVAAAVRTGTTGSIDINIYKKGAGAAFASFSSQYSGVISSIVYCDGISDYIELYAYTSSARAYSTGAAATFMAIVGPF